MCILYVLLDNVLYVLLDNVLYILLDNVIYVQVLKNKSCLCSYFWVLSECFVMFTPMPYTLVKKILYSVSI